MTHFVERIENPTIKIFPVEDSLKISNLKKKRKTGDN